MRPLPAATDMDVEGLVVQAPPVGAVPQPVAIVLSKESSASVVTGGMGVTVTDLVVVLVAPPLSVTVRLTV